MTDTTLTVTRCDDHYTAGIMTYIQPAAAADQWRA